MPREKPSRFHETRNFSEASAEIWVLLTSREREDLILCGKILLLELLRLSPGTVRFQTVWLRKYVKTSLFPKSRDSYLIWMLTWPIKQDKCKCIVRKYSQQH